MGCTLTDEESFEASRSLSNTERGDSQKNGFMGILTVSLLLTVLVIYLFGWDTLTNWISKLMGVI